MDCLFGFCYTFLYTENNTKVIINILLKNDFVYCSFLCRVSIYLCCPVKTSYLHCSGDKQPSAEAVRKSWEDKLLQFNVLHKLQTLLHELFFQMCHLCVINVSQLKPPLLKATHSAQTTKFLNKDLHI